MPKFHRDIQVKRQQVTGFQCNRCNEKFTMDDIVEMRECMEWITYCGYGSVWGDGTRVEVTLCQQCTLDLFGNFATIHDD